MISGVFSNSEKPERAPKQSCACNIRRLTQGIDAVSKCKQRSVDVSAFYHSFATILQRKEGFTFTSNNVTAPAHAKLLQHPFELALLNQRRTVILLKWNEQGSFPCSGGEEAHFFTFCQIGAKLQHYITPKMTLIIVCIPHHK